MNTDDRVNALNVLWASASVVAIKIWVRTTVYCLSTVDDLSKGRGKLLVGGIT